MYWPIGSPNAYALPNYENTPSSVITHSDDGVSDESEGVTTDASAARKKTEREQDEDLSDGHSIGGRQSPKNGTENGCEILAARPSRGGTIFVTITARSVTVWQAKPTVALAAVHRSDQSLRAYGSNTALYVRPDSLIVVVQTENGFLISYSLATDPQARVFRTQLPRNARHTRHDSSEGYTAFRRTAAAASSSDLEGFREVHLRFRMVIRIDAGISSALALDQELIVATTKPAALQSIRWVTEHGSSQTSTELLGRMPWIVKKSPVVNMTHDRPMNLSCWVTADGRAYAVQKHRAQDAAEASVPQSLFQGFCFHDPESEDMAATRISINARFSLISVGCRDGQTYVYAVKDYMGNIPLSHVLQLPVSSGTTGKLSLLAFSPDGYCLFAGYEHGWAMWSAFGKLGAHTFNADRNSAVANNEKWLLNVQDGFWVGGGSELISISGHDDRVWLLEMVRHAATACLSPANVFRGLLYTSDSIILHKGHEETDLTDVPAELSLWQTIQLPSSYLSSQWPISSAVVSPDGKYVAVAGRRGLVHYSVTSGRWKLFDDPQAEAEFAVRGGMCWYQHFLIASVDAGGKYQVRVYSREKNLGVSQVLHREELQAPAILTTLSGTDSVLVYTHDNTVQHFVIVTSGNTIKLVQVGQIGFHGIIRAPARVRAISWILPEDQLEHGDPSEDVATASVIFLVDAKLVLLQPSANEQGELKYDMRVIAQNVEYYMLLRDFPSTLESAKLNDHSATSDSLPFLGPLGHGLRDSLWYFSGEDFFVWSDIQDVLARAPVELGRELPAAVRVPIDFYPISAMIMKGIIYGADADLIQRRDVNFSYFRQSTRSQLFLPSLLRYHLSEYNSPTALHLANSYRHLPYFAHALEILVHVVLDFEVDNPPSPPETALLPTVVSFLSSFEQYLDVIVNCTRKTEVRSWRTLFSYLPPVMELFEQSLAEGRLKTAGGYLLVLHTLGDGVFQTKEFSRLLRRASDEHDWDLCRELSRFLMGIDSSGEVLRSALTEAGIGSTTNGHASIDGSISTISSPDGNGAAQTGVVRASDYFSLAQAR